MSEKFAKTSSVEFGSELKKSYLDYAMTVIVNRAIPNAFDGCKPVQRRILHAMAEAGYYHNSPHKKSVAIVGLVVGKYHPHGDTAIYDALVRMAQNFSLNMPLIDGQGNFGSIDGDSPASMRYTECRLNKIAKYIVDDYDQNTVDLIDNYDNSLKMPSVLPATFPNLLVNGAYGIAVGMSTSIPPHNLGEVIDATCAMLNKPDISLEEVLTYIKGPDLPTGATIIEKDFASIYREGRGSFKCRGEVGFEGNDIIIKEIPFQLNKSKLVEEIVNLAKSEEVPEISEVRDESSLEGIRVVICLKRGSDPELISRHLYQKTSLQTSINFCMLALQGGVPKQFGLVDFLKYFIDQREQIIIRRSKYHMQKAKYRAHVLWGHALAISKLEEIISHIKSSNNKEEAIEKLSQLTWPKDYVQQYLSLINISDGNEEVRFSNAQIKSILDIRLQSLTTLEQGKIVSELKDLGHKISNLQKLLDNRSERYHLMKMDMLKIKKEFIGSDGNNRNTKIEPSIEDDTDLSLIEKKDCVISLSYKGYIKRIDLDSYRTQNRGGKGKRGDYDPESGDFTEHMTVANTHDEILFFSSKGIAYSMLVAKLPENKARSIINLINIEKDEKITALLSIKESNKEAYLMFVTSRGYIRRNLITDFAKIRKTGKQAVPVDEQEMLASVIIANNGDEVMISSSGGRCVRFNIDKVKLFKGRKSKGVRGMRLDDESKVICASIIPQGEAKTNILTVTERGFGKVSKISEYRLTQRDVKGVIAASIDEKTGSLIGAYQVSPNDEVLLMSSKGQTIRCALSNIRNVSRSSKGVHVVRLQKDDFITNAFIIKEIDEDTDEKVKCSLDIK